MTDIFPIWMIVAFIVASVIGGIIGTIAIISICCKIEETHETVLWIKDKLDHDP